MAKRTLESLGMLVKHKRGDLKLRETARKIGIGPATLMRIENGHTPDLTTFGKICQWLGIDPGEFFGISKNNPSQDSGFIGISAHLRADQTPHQNTVQALAQMIILATRMQPASKENVDVEL